MNNLDLAYISSCRGTLGELYQGPLFIKNFVYISIISALSNSVTKVQFIPGKMCNLEKSKKFKVKEAVDKFLYKFSKNDFKGHWIFKSNLEIGAGMSSSTSDIVCALRCISKAINKVLTIKDITQVILNVERSDPVFINSPCLYLSQNQILVELYKNQKKIYCIYSLEKQTIDTTQTQYELIEYYKKNKTWYIKLLNNVRKAFLTLNTYEIIKNSIQSAVLSQGVFPKKNFWNFYTNYKRLGANGIIVAHTGSLIGLLYSSKPNKKDENLAKDFLLKQSLKPNFGVIF